MGKTTLPKDLKWSKYTLLNQIPINKNYEANDNGVFSLEYNKKEDTYEKHLICEAFTITMINTDRSNNEEIVEIQFVNYATGKPVKISKQIPTKSLNEKEGIKELEANGFTIVNEPGYKKFIMTLKVNLNQLVREEIENPNTERFYGSRHYGFEVIDGEYNYNNFIGIDSPIMPDSSFDELGKVLFAKQGDLKGEKEFLDWISEGSKCEIIYKQVVACALMGVTKAFLGKTIDNPVIDIISPTSSGKGFLDHIVQKCWGRISDEKGISVSSGSSSAGLAPFKDRLYIIPAQIADLTDFIKRNGVEAAGSICYEQTNANNTIKAQSDRQISKFNYSWKNVLMMYEEKEELKQQKEGIVSRTVFLKTGLKRPTTTSEGEKVSERDFVEIDKKQHENYGILGPEFVKAIRKYYDDHSIRSEFGEVMAKYEKTLKTSSKNAAIYALIEYTYNLAYDFKLLPERWGKMTIKDNLSNYEMAEEISSDEEIYNLMRDRILTQTNAYIDINLTLKKANYEEREKNGQAVRGRIAIKKYEGVDYKIAIIPKDIFNQNVADLIKKHALPSMRVNPKNWVENGWLMPSGNKRTDHDGTNITREYDSEDNMKRTKERCYWVILQNLDAVEEPEQEYFEFTTSQKKELNKFTTKWIEPKEGMMYIPDGMNQVKEVG